jgi:hypothetical protein
MGTQQQELGTPCATPIACLKHCQVLCGSDMFSFNLIRAPRMACLHPSTLALHCLKELMRCLPSWRAFMPSSMPRSLSALHISSASR